MLHPITRGQMKHELQRLKEHKVSRRYTVSDLAFLTGWSPNWIRLMELRGEIPKAGARKRRHGRRGGLRWTEAAARRILGLKQERMH